MAGRKNPPTPAPDLATYRLGPQSDGASVLRIPDDFSLMILRKAAEKQSKNAVAADGTLAALAEGDDPWLSKVQDTLTRLVKIITVARAPENQVADTPIGKEINAAAKAALAGDTPEPIDGRPGDVWAPHVPTPRPKVGEVITWPTGDSCTVASIDGYDPDGEPAFAVLGSDGLKYRITIAPSGLGWYIAGSAYKPAPVTSAADDLTAGTSLDPDHVEADYEIVGEDDMPETDAEVEPRRKGGLAVEPKDGGKQRTRNARQAGVTKTAAPKKGGKKGGKT